MTGRKGSKCVHTLLWSLWGTHLETPGARSPFRASVISLLPLLRGTVKWKLWVLVDVK